MQLIEPLASGRSSCASGVAYVRDRAGQYIAYYEDYEGDVAVAAGTPVQLDADGAAVVYVDQVATVTMVDVNGVTKAAFTVGGYDANVEVRSPAFTGVDYATSQSMVNRPVTAGALYDRWKTVNGSIDWKVLINGQELPIPEAIAVAADCFNVKNAAYSGGAVGDGVEDDTSAILAALTACDNAGGGVVCFPPGSYRVTQELSIPATVSLRGTSPSLSSIVLDGVQMVFPGSGTLTRQYVSGLSIDFAQGSSDLMIELFDAAVLFYDCWLNVEALSAGSGIVGQLTAGNVTSFLELRMLGCKVGLSDMTSIASQSGVHTLALTIAKCSVEIHQTEFIYESVISSGYAVNSQDPKVVNCKFTMPASLNVTGTAGGVYGANGGNVVGCDFVEPTTLTGAWYCCRVTHATSTEVFHEAANRFGSGNFPTQFLKYLSTTISPGGLLKSRMEQALLVEGDDDASFTADGLNYDTIVNNRTAIGDQAIAITKGPPGARVLVVVDQRDGIASGVGASLPTDESSLITWGTNVRGRRSVEQIFGQQVRHFWFEFFYDSEAGVTIAREIGEPCDELELSIISEAPGAATVYHDYDLETVWPSLPADCYMEFEIDGFAVAGTTESPFRSVYLLRYTASALTIEALLDYGNPAPTPPDWSVQISSNKLRVGVDGTPVDIDYFESNIRCKRIWEV